MKYDSTELLDKVARIRLMFDDVVDEIQALQKEIDRLECEVRDLRIDNEDLRLGRY